MCMCVYVCVALLPEKMLYPALMIIICWGVTWDDSVTFTLLSFMCTYVQCVYWAHTHYYFYYYYYNTISPQKNSNIC